MGGELPIGRLCDLPALMAFYKVQVPLDIEQNGYILEDLLVVESEKRIKDDNGR